LLLTYLSYSCSCSRVSPGYASKTFSSSGVILDTYELPLFPPFLEACFFYRFASSSLSFSCFFFSFASFLVMSSSSLAISISDFFSISLFYASISNISF